MTCWDDRLRVEGIRLVRDRQDPRVFHYLPDDPTPQRDPAGHPMLSLLLLGELAMLQLTTEWRADSEALERARLRLPEMLPDLDSPADVVLAPSPIDIEEARLELLGAAPRVIARSGTSGAPPYSALFNVSLRAGEAAEAQAALRGRRGLLLVRYLGSLPGQSPWAPSGEPLPISASADVAGWLPAGSDNDHVRVLGA